jgi:hypothetical protein
MFSKHIKKTLDTFTSISYHLYNVVYTMYFIKITILGGDNEKAFGIMFGLVCVRIGPGRGAKRRRGRETLSFW